MRRKQWPAYAVDVHSKNLRKGGLTLSYPCRYRRLTPRSSSHAYRAGSLAIAASPRGLKGGDPIRRGSSVDGRCIWTPSDTQEPGTVVVDQRIRNRRSTETFKMSAETAINLLSRVYIRGTTRIYENQRIQDLFKKGRYFQTITEPSRFSLGCCKRQRPSPAFHRSVVSLLPPGALLVRVGLTTRRRVVVDNLRRSVPFGRRVWVVPSRLALAADAVIVG